MWGEYLHLFLPSQLPVFCLGLVLYRCVQNRQYDAASAATPLLGIAALVVVGQHITTRIPENVSFSVGFACMAYCLSIYPTRILVNRWTVFTGKLSFSLYLVHFAVLHFAARVFARPIVPIATADLALKFVGCVGVSSLIAYATYRLVELPGQALGAVVIERLNRSQTMAIAAAADA
jgi:peptidoglycan/LPS O-acetylase OafA/YrhL